MVVFGRLAPDQLDDLLDQEGEPECEDELCDVAKAVDVAETVALDQGANHTDQQRCHHKAAPKAEIAGYCVRKIGA